MYKTPGRGLSISTEVVNNTIGNIVVTNTGIGAEFVAISNYEDEYNFSLKNKILVRVSIDGDPRKINFLEGEIHNPFDRYIREQLRDKIKADLYPEEGKNTQPNHFVMLDDRKHYESHYTIDIMLEPLKLGETFESKMFSIHIRREEDVEKRPSVSGPMSDIKEAFIPALIENESVSEKGEDNGIRTISAIRLVDSKNLIGDLWTNVFGKPTEVRAVRASKLQDGLYIASGYCFGHVEFVPLEDLMLDNKLIHYGLFKTKREADNNAVGEYVKTVIARNTDLFKHNTNLIKENKTLSDTNVNLDKKVRDLDSELKTVKGELKAKVTSLETKHARAIDDLKSQNAHLTKVMETMKSDHRRELSETVSRYDWDKRKTMERYEQDVKRIKENGILDLLGNVGRVLAGFVASITGFVRLAGIFKLI